MSSTNIVEAEVLTEVPETLKRLVRYIVRGFYEIEHALVIDLLVHHPCVKEEDLMDLLKFDQKQLRTAINTLKSDKFLKVRMRMETNAEGRTNKHNYYFINYSTFVNVVKFKLDHVRKKIDMEERNMTSRASFRCPRCEKTFTDLEAGQLFDPFVGEMRCTYCQTEVEEDASVLPKTDSRKLIVRFNEQLEPIFALLREVEDIKLSQELLEPEPTEIGRTRTGGSSRQPGDNTVWSGEKRQSGFGFTESGFTINIEGEGQTVAAPTVARREQPIWMTQSTIQGAVTESATSDSAGPSRSDDQAGARSTENDDIMKTLLAHEKKAKGGGGTGIPGARQGAPPSEDSSDSDSDMDTSSSAVKPLTSTAAASTETMASDEDEDAVVTVTVNGQSVPYHEVTEDMVQRMNPAEKEAYIRTGQEMYEDMYD